MPRVPTFNRQVGVQRINAPRSTALQANFNPGNTAGILANQIGAFEKERQRSQNKADELAVLKAKNEIDAKSSSLIEEVRQQKGEHALSTPDFFEKNFKDVRSSVESRLTDRQKERFSIYSDKTYNQSNLAVNRHVNNESERLYDGTFKARLDNLHNKVAENAYSPKDISMSILEQKNEIDKYGSNKGMTKDQIDNMKMNSESSSHRMAMESMIANNDDIVAKKYFDEVSGQLNRQDRIALQGKLEVSSRLGEAQRASDQVMGMQGISLSDGLKIIRDRTEDPETQKLAVAEFKTRFNERKTSENIEETELFQDLYNKLADGANYSQLDRSKVATLTPSMQNSLANYASSRGTKKVKDGAYFDALQAERIMAIKDPDGFKQKKASYFASKFDEGHAGEFMKMQLGLHKESPDKFTQGLLTKTQFISREIKSLKEQGLLSKDQESQYFMYADEEFDKYREEHGREPNKDEIKKIIERGVIEHKEPEGWFRDKKKMFQLTEEEIPSWVTQDPDELDPEIRDSISRRKGRKDRIREDNIREMVAQMRKAAANAGKQYDESRAYKIATMMYDKGK